VDRVLRALCPLGAVSLPRYVNQTLLAGAMPKFKRFKGHKIQAGQFLQWLAKERVGLFVHRQLGMTGTFTRWVRRESHARFYEEPAVKFRRPTHPFGMTATCAGIAS